MKRSAQVAAACFALVGCLCAQDGGKLSTLVYADYFYNIQSDTGLSTVALPGPGDVQGFRFRRIYLTYDYRLDETFSTRFRLEADESALSSDGKTSVFVKDAYFRWKNILGSSDLVLGIQPTPAFEVSEEYWGYRSLEKTIQDLRGLVGSRDFGVSLDGAVDASGTIGYRVFLANGSGNRPETDKWKRYYGQIRVRPLGGVDVTLTGDYNVRPEITNPFTGSKSSNSTTTVALFAGFAPAEELRVGAEAVLQTTENGFNTGTRLTSRQQMGISVFGRWRVEKDLELLGRYDYFDRNNHSLATGDRRGYIIAGIAWSPGRNVLVIPNIQVETLEATSSRSFDPSVVGRLTVVWSTP